MGKIRGTPCMRSHMFVHRATAKYFSNSFVFKTEIEKEGLPGDITPALGPGGPGFKSRRPDHLLLCFQFTLPGAVCPRNRASLQWTVRRPGAAPDGMIAGKG